MNPEGKATMETTSIITMFLLILSLLLKHQVDGSAISIDISIKIFCGNKKIALT